MAKEEQKSKEKNSNSLHMQVYSIVTSKDPSWQNIIYELINSEQLDPWDINITLLCRAYFDRIREIEEHDFFVSSKILLAAALLLRIKSEILADKHIKEIDDILFGRKEEEQKKLLERIEIDEDELPLLMPKSPLPRFKKVTLDELMSALETAIKTESRRIEREVQQKQRERLAYIDIPKVKRINIQDRIRQLYAKILSAFKHPKHKSSLKMPFSHFTGNNKEEKLVCFLPLLHLSNTDKIWIEQAKHFDEIWIYMYKTFKESFPEHDKDLREFEENLREEVQEVAEQLEEGIKERRGRGRTSKMAENPVGNLISREENEE